MSKVVVTIDTDGAAFADDPTEARRLLRVAADRITGLSLTADAVGSLVDSNGNTCGKWAIVPDTRPEWVRQHVSVIQVPVPPKRREITLPTTNTEKR